MRVYHLNAGSMYQRHVRERVGQPAAAEGGHVHLREHDAAVTKKIESRKGRYVDDQWRHGPDWNLLGGGEDWYGFKGVRALGEGELDILLTACTVTHRDIAALRCAAGRNRCSMLATVISFMARSGLRWYARRSCSALSNAWPTPTARVANQERVRRLKAEHGQDQYLQWSRSDR